MLTVHRRVKSGGTHIALSAASRNSVDACFFAALKAGGRDNGEPVVRNPQTGYYSAAILDLDNNSIEIVHRDPTSNQDSNRLLTMPDHHEGSRVLTWQKDVARSTSDNRSTVSRAPLQPVDNNVNSPAVIVSHESHTTKQNGDPNSKAVVGTLLGAAAGAAIAYIMTKGEAESSSPILERTTTIYRSIGAPLPSSKAPSAYYDHPPSRYQTIASSRLTRSYPLAIEAPKAPNSRSTLIDTFVSPTEIPRNFLPKALSITKTLIRSYTDPPAQARSSVSHHEGSKAPTHVSSAARTVTQEDYPPAAVARSSAGTSASKRNDRGVVPSAAPSRHSTARSSHSRALPAESVKSAHLVPLPPSTVAKSSRSHSHHGSHASSRRHSSSHHTKSAQSHHGSHQSKFDEEVTPDDSISRVDEREDESDDDRAKRSTRGGRRRVHRSIVTMPVGSGRRGDGGLRSVATQVLGAR